MELCPNCLTAQLQDGTIANRTIVQVSNSTLKLLRRLQHLQSGRHEILITVDDDGNVGDWSVRSWGKVER